ncbi:MAG: acyltransferase [Halochromatium sp.]|nr:acyltransferase [Halochromatium sp.]
MDTRHYIPSIDGLRAVAVLAVMLYHLDPQLLPGGFTGVDVFFVISGYVVSASLARDQARGFLGFTLGFYARRILRIFPALIVCLLLVTLLSTVLIPQAWLSDSSDKTGLFAFFGISNIALVLFNDGYFSPRVEFNPFTHTWSLGVEEQFYLLFPLIVFVWLHFRTRPGWVGFSAEALLAGLMVTSLAIAWWLTPRHPDWAFYLLPTRFWELAAGGLLFKLHHRGACLAQTAFSRAGLLIAGLGLIGFALGWSEKTAFPFPWAIPAVLGTVLTIAAVAVSQARATEPRPWLQRLLEQPLALHIGKTSYSLYLWHWPVYVLMRWTLGLEPGWRWLLAVGLTFLLAEASYRFVEIPVRRNAWSRRQPPWLTVGIGLATIGLAFWIADQTIEARPQLSLSVTRDQQTWYPEPWPSHTERQAPDFSQRQLFAIGDSHVGAYSTMLQQLADAHGVKLWMHSIAACPVASLISDMEAAGPACVNEVERNLQQIEAQAQPGDIVFLASLRMHRFSDQFKRFRHDLVLKIRDSAEADAKRQRALEETSALIERLQAQGLHVIIDAPKPVFRSPPFRCADWFNRHNPICRQGLTMPRAELLEHRAAVMRSLQRLQTHFSDLLVWDPFPILCPGETCSAFDGEQPLFFDADHLSGYGNTLLYPSFFSLLSKIWSIEEAGEEASDG